MIINNSILQNIMKMMETWKNRNATWHVQEKRKKKNTYNTLLYSNIYIYIYIYIIYCSLKYKKYKQ